MRREIIRRQQNAPFERLIKTIAIFVLTMLVSVILHKYYEEDDKPFADIVVVNSKIWTGDVSNPWAEALAVTKDKIMFIGKSKQVESLISKKTKVFNGSSDNFQLVVPGFIDSHIHLVQGGFALTAVDLRHSNTKEEFVATIAEYAAKVPKGAWITEGNSKQHEITSSGSWNHENWGGELPDKTWIDSVTPEHPVWISRLDGHMALANSLAIKLAGVTKETPEIAGGTIVRDSEGNPTGIFKDNSMELIQKVIPLPSIQQEDEALEVAMKYVNSFGVTSGHHMGMFSESWRDLDVFERANKRKKLTVRTYVAITLSDWNMLAEKIQYSGKGDKWLKIGHAFVDGSLGSHTALLSRPYTGFILCSGTISSVDTNSTDLGLTVTPKDQLLNWITNADRNNLQISVHAIGDQANTIILDTYEKVISLNGNKDRRFRVEHAQQIRDEDMGRYVKNDIIASMQPYHLLDDGQWAEKILGDRINEMYPFKSLLQQKTRLAFGSDWFVAPPIPLQGIYAAVTRRTLDGKNAKGWIPSQKITVEEALRAYTVDAAFASFDEDIKGKLARGFLADFVLIDKDITSIEPEEIWNCSIRATIVGGKVVYNGEPLDFHGHTTSH